MAPQYCLHVIHTMGQALYRKYRPKALAEIVGQKHITDTLTNAIANGKISHAYLLTGPRGVGKTSVARILAHQVNNIDYDESQHHLDIIEIDAASNRRIDEIRDLRDKVHILPSSATYKVYIIDEVHMLTREAFNALLKTLEEPPKHAIFILATTEAHKLPETIISRTQHFSFKPIEIQTIVTHLKKIAKDEKIIIDSDALNLIAEHGDGSFRDSISLLDQARSLSTNITIEQVQSLLGVAADSALESVLHIITNGTPKELFEKLALLRGQGLQSSIIASQLSSRIRMLLIDDATYQTTRSTELLQQLLVVPASSQPDRMLEIVLLEYIFKNNPRTETIEPARIDDPSHTAATSQDSPSSPRSKQTSDIDPVEAKNNSPAALAQSETSKIATEQPTIKAEAPKKVEPQKVIEKAASETVEPKIEQSKDQEQFSEAMWPIVVAQVKKTNNTIYGILRMSEMSYQNKTITLTFKFAFHQKQINDSKNRKLIEDIIRQHTGEEISITCQVNKKVEKAHDSIKASPVVDLQSVSNIFGGGEVLESEA
jgi:DNA polymerase III subunit gamma/tau